jgi:hypothetical protein
VVLEAIGEAEFAVKEAHSAVIAPQRDATAAARAAGVVWTSLGPLPQWVPGPTTRWALGTTRLALHGT